MNQQETDSTKRILVGVCTYNEIDCLPKLIDKIHAAVPNADILVVDDDSPDGTGEWISAKAKQVSSITAIVRKDTRGLGSAILAAMQYSIAKNYDLFVNLDSDLSHDPGAIPTMLEIAASEDVDVVLGSRYIEGGAIEGWPLSRRVISAILNRCTRTFLRIPVRDCSGSFRCYQVAMLEKVDLSRVKSQGYSMLEELLWLLARSGARFRETPIRFVNRVEGESKLNAREALRSVLMLVRTTFRRA